MCRGKSPFGGQIKKKWLKILLQWKELSVTVNRKNSYSEWKALLHKVHEKNYLIQWIDHNYLLWRAGVEYKTLCLSPYSTWKELSHTVNGKKKTFSCNEWIRNYLLLGHVQKRKKSVYLLTVIENGLTFLVNGRKTIHLQ